jgi:inositol-phosphate transport system permease protein
MNVQRLQRHLYSYLFLLPFLLLATLFFVIPAGATIWMAFTDLDAGMAPNFIGLENFARLANDPYLLGIATVTILFTFFSLMLVLLLGLALAIGSQYLVRARQLGVLYRTFWLIPSIMPSVVYVAFWKYIFDPSEAGLVNGFLVNNAGFDTPISFVTRYALPIVVLATGIAGASGGMIIFSAAINAMPQDIFKAARIDGASDWSIITDLILPWLRWPIMYVTISEAIGLMATYYFIVLLTGGGPVFDSTTLALYSYRMAFGSLRYGYGAALSLIVVGISLVLTIILLRLFDFDTLMHSSRIDV